ncbi:MAG: TetR/AcrR family transcriptional regulator [Bacteroidales bacterium]|nr:TetR/AcrR family transcriptional regulator [Bacteroidales bacterium]
MCPRTAKQFENIRADKRKQIIDAALVLFANKGYHATSISMIAKRAGISKGLMYNYFESKEALLYVITDEITTNIMDMMNPDHDDEITSLEMRDFFTLLFESLKEQAEQWKLFYQISMQKDVLDYLAQQNQSEKAIKSKQLIYKYFAERFENPEVEMVLFFSLFKGFSMQYVFEPKLFSEEIIAGFKAKLIKIIVKEKSP